MQQESCSQVYKDLRVTAEATCQLRAVLGQQEPSPSAGTQEVTGQSHTGSSNSVTHRCVHSDPLKVLHIRNDSLKMWK